MIKVGFPKFLLENQKRLRKMAGFTLTEIVVALAVSAAVFTGIITLFTFSTKVSREALNQVRLTQELTLALNVMSKGIQRAGYRFGSASDIAAGNPFMVGDADIHTNGSNNCILFSYDANKDGLLPALGMANDERFGFRLSDNAIQYRLSGSDFNCDSSSSQWVNLTDPNVINVSVLSFVKNVSSISLGGTATLKLREITITITANLISDPSVFRTFSRTVKVYNNLFSPS